MTDSVFEEGLFSSDFLKDTITRLAELSSVDPHEEKSLPVVLETQPSHPISRLLD
jgi:hypothetical protein